MPENFNDPETAFATGKEYLLDSVTISKSDIIDFASEFDPAPFHLDEKAAEASLLGGLSASGFHTCAICMKMICDRFLLASTSQGAAEVEVVKWLAPVKPGDTLSGTTTVLEGRRSSSRPNLWIARLRHQLKNQDGIDVLDLIVIGLLAIPGEAS